jgi:hypothetical protein
MSIPIEALRKVTRIIVHADCPDGMASAMILHDVLPDAEVIAVQYGPGRDALEPGPADLFCDMTPPPTKVDAFVKAGAIVLDHHRGAHELVERFGELGVFADEEAEPGVSGAVLAFREVWRPLRSIKLSDDKTVALGVTISDFARLAGVRDCWLRAAFDWVAACEQAEALMFHPLSYWLATGHPPHLYAGEKALGHTLLNTKLRHAREIAETGCLRLSPSVAVFNADGRVVSDVAEAMREVDPDVTLVVGFFYTVKDGAMSLVFSLRSNPGAELTARQVAAVNGGGGHDHAAGFTTHIAGGTDSEDLRSPLSVLQFALRCARSFVR